MLRVAFLGCFVLISIYMASICGRGLVSNSLAPDVGRKTALEALGTFYLWKRAFLLRLLAIFCLIYFVLIPGYAVLIRTQWPVFPTTYAALLGGGYLLFATLTYFSYKWFAHNLRTIQWRLSA